MKKILAVLLATSSVAVFADTFQDFNNNLYASYNNSSVAVPAANGNSYSTNGYGIGGTFQSKNDVWANVSISNQVINGSGGADNYTPVNVRAGYAFQFFGDDDSGFQVIPYLSFAATDSSDYAWGIGVQPEYRLLSSLKASLGLGLNGYNGTNSATCDGLLGCDPKNTMMFGYNVNPEVQYDIAKTVMLSVGYNYASSFSASDQGTASTVTAKVGYLF